MCLRSRIPYLVCGFSFEELILKMIAGKTKSAFIVETIDEKLGLVKNREKTIRQLAGWLTHEEAEELRTNS